MRVFISPRWNRIFQVMIRRKTGGITPLVWEWYTVNICKADARYVRLDCEKNGCVWYLLFAALTGESSFVGLPDVLDTA